MNTTDSNRREFPTRRDLIIGMAGALAAVGATAVAQAPNPSRDIDPQEIANRLDAVAQDLQQISIRLDSINTGNNDRRRETDRVLFEKIE